MNQEIREAHRAIIHSLAVLVRLGMPDDVKVKGWPGEVVDREQVMAQVAFIRGAADRILSALSSAPETNGERVREYAAKCALTGEYFSPTTVLSMLPPPKPKFSEVRDQPVLSATKTADGFRVEPAAPSRERLLDLPGLVASMHPDHAAPSGESVCATCFHPSYSDACLHAPEHQFTPTPEAADEDDNDGCAGCEVCQDTPTPEAADTQQEPRLHLTWTQRADGFWNADCPCGSTLCGWERGLRHTAEFEHAQRHFEIAQSLTTKIDIANAELAKVREALDILDPYAPRCADESPAEWARRLLDGLRQMHKNFHAQLEEIGALRAEVERQRAEFARVAAELSSERSANIRFREELEEARGYVKEPDTVNYAVIRAALASFSGKPAMAVATMDHIEAIRAKLEERDAELVKVREENERLQRYRAQLVEAGDALREKLEEAERERDHYKGAGELLVGAEEERQAAEQRIEKLTREFEVTSDTLWKHAAPIILKEKPAEYRKIVEGHDARMSALTRRDGENQEGK